MTTLRKPVRRISNAAAANYGPDRGKRLVVTITPNPAGDVLELRPERTRRAESVLLADVYQWALRCRVNAAKMQRLRDKKAKKAAARATRKANRAVRDWPTSP